MQIILYIFFFKKVAKKYINKCWNIYLYTNIFIIKSKHKIDETKNILEIISLLLTYIKIIIQKFPKDKNK